MSDRQSASFVSYRREGRVGVVTLHRPEALNAVSTAGARELATLVNEIAADRDVWAVLLTGEGDRAFCVGADLKERAAFDLDDYHANRVHMRAMFAAVRALPQPSIAAIFGFTLGGGLELALSCDLIVAADDSVIGLPEVTVGLVPAGGATQLLPRRIGTAKAKDMIFTGERLSARQAEMSGLISRVVARSVLDDAALSLAEHICRSSPVAVREAKRAIDAAPGAPLEEGLEIENDAWRATVSSADRVEGVAAFNERREPRWSNT
ncbi:MAG: enoyl-CoA hydratase/isomerase family protein [Actinobacteria bacterium]|nr:enoyl-CoA hydratase/isomerase family protein [Actinomycetota bacterium]